MLLATTSQAAAAAAAEADFSSLAIIWVIAFLAPLALALFPKLRIPNAVIEILLGIVIGPAVLDWVHPDSGTLLMRSLGLAFLLFLGGMELELGSLRGRRLKTAGTSYLVAIGVALLATSALWSVNFLLNPLLLAIALSSTSLGVIIPVLKDGGHLHTPLGLQTVACGTVAEFAPIILLALFFSSSGDSPTQTLGILALFALLFALIVWTFVRGGRSDRLTGAFSRFQDTTAQLRVRATVALVAVLSALAGSLQLDTILGAFLAGALLSTIDEERDARYGRLRGKLEAIGHGVFVPVFFVMTGVTFDLRGLLSSPSNLMRVVVFDAILLLAGIVPALVMRKRFGMRKALASGFLGATSLSLLVVAVSLGEALHQIRPENATALVAAGMVSVLAFPAIGSMLLGKSSEQEAVPDTEMGEGL